MRRIVVQSFLLLLLLALMTGVRCVRAADTGAPAVAGTPAPRKSASPSTPARGTSAPQSTSAPNSGAASANQPQANPSSAPVPRLPTLVVTATRIAQPIGEIGSTVSVVNDRQIQIQKIEEVGEVLRQVPGVEVDQSGSHGTLTEARIRGANPSQTLVLIDGVEVNGGANGLFDFANLTTDNLDRIEVLRGAGGSLYGSSAVGGVINVLSREGEGAPRFSLLSEGGSRATQRQVATFSGASGRLGYSGALSYYSTTGFRPINDSSDNLAGNARLDWHPTDDTTLRGFARYSRSNVSLVNFSVFSGSPLDPDAHQRDEFYLFAGEGEHRFSDKLVARWRGSFVRQEIRINQFFDPANLTAESDYFPDEIRGTNLEAIYTWAPDFRTLAGFDFKDRWARSGDNLSIPAFGFQAITLFRAERQEYAGYVQQEARLLDGLILATGGFRADGYSDFGQQVSPSWTVAIPVSKIDTTFRGSYSEGFRAPSFNDLFFPNFGNPNLQPEVSSEYDGGFTHTFGESASLSTTYFSRRVKNLIVAVPCPTCLFGSQAGNAGRVDAQGVEIAPEARMGRFKLSGSFTLIDETHRSSSANIRPLRVPKHSASALAQYTHPGLLRPLDTLNLVMSYVFVGDRDDIDTSSMIRSHVGYHRFDAVASYAAGYRWGRLRNEEIYTRVQNLFDRNYSENFGFKAPPINFVAGVKLEF